MFWGTQGVFENKTTRRFRVLIIPLGFFTIITGWNELTEIFEIEESKIKWSKFFPKKEEQAVQRKITQVSQYKHQRHKSAAPENKKITLPKSQPNDISDWQLALNQNTENSYQNYISKWPSGFYKDEALRKLKLFVDARNTIQNSQKALKNAGCYNGVLDGVWGNQSNTALTRYKKQIAFSILDSKYDLSSYESENFSKDLQQLELYCPSNSTLEKLDINYNCTPVNYESTLPVNFHISFNTGKMRVSGNVVRFVAETGNLKQYLPHLGYHEQAYKSNYGITQRNEFIAIVNFKNETLLGIKYAFWVLTTNKIMEKFELHIRAYDRNGLDLWNNPILPKGKLAAKRFQFSCKQSRY